MAENELHEIIIDMMKEERRGAVLDMGAGEGALSEKLNAMGFEVIACDIDTKKI